MPIKKKSSKKLSKKDQPVTKRILEAALKPIYARFEKIQIQLDRHEVAINNLAKAVTQLVFDVKSLKQWQEDFDRKYGFLQNMQEYMDRMFQKLFVRWLQHFLKLLCIF